MFMCRDCHKEDEKKYGCLHAFTSWGKCELCETVAHCTDCKSYKRSTPPNTPDEYPMATTSNKKAQLREKLYILQNTCKRCKHMHTVGEPCRATSSEQVAQLKNYVFEWGVTPGEGGKTKVAHIAEAELADDAVATSVAKQVDADRVWTVDMPVENHNPRTIYSRPKGTPEEEEARLLELFRVFWEYGMSSKKSHPGTGQVHEGDYFDGPMASRRKE